MAADGITTAPEPVPPRQSASSPPTVGTLLTRASAAGDRHRGCSSPRSLLSRILHRGRGGGGFGCRLRLLPRYCASASAAAAKEDAVAVTTAGTAEAAKHEEEDKPAEVAAPTAVVPAQPARREPGSPRSSLGKDALPASLGLGASLVLLLSKSAAELGRMAELRAQMERLLLDARADVRSCNGRPSASVDRTTDCASVVKGPVARSGGDGSRAGTAAPASRRASEDGGRRDMDRMKAELEAELSLLQLQRASDVEDDSPRLRRRDDQLELQEAPKSSASSGSRSTICSDSDNDDGETDNGGGGDESQDRDDDEEEVDEDEDDERDADEGNGIKSPPHGGVSARELERRLHQLLQSRHEARIAELESALERARQKLRETEREACRWRDTAKLATRFADESRLR
ncbi:protein POLARALIZATION DURING ASYMMETRIC DIVISION AND REDISTRIBUTION-like [Miscanthus floridulus]|uniref:protein POLARALIZATION DURING ASYMMETRIC DIVISION AND REDISTRIBUTION-like n=1 Tax=Miscanthus floridulus TaxID=154761 RepID=UPI0034582187